jgi:23S rRNA pseudouridine1911/1915/1917 synthase
VLAEAIKALGRQALHATRLGLVHPVSGEEMSWEVELPEDMERLLDVLHDE